MKGWRTVLFNLALGIPPVLELSSWRDLIPDEWWPFYVIGAAGVNLILRSITTTPIGAK